jgi:hypothetical protein
VENIRDLFYLLYQILSMLWLYIAMPCSQMHSNHIGYGGEPTNLAHEKAVCREKDVGILALHGSDCKFEAVIVMVIVTWSLIVRSE